MKRIAIVGMGWLGLPLAFALEQKEYLVKGSVTSPEKKERLTQQGLQTHLVLLTETGIAGDHLSLLDNTDIAILLVPPGLRRNSGHNHALKMAHLLQAIEASDLQKVILISSTGVYADNQGEVDEDTIPIPETNSGRQLWEVEQIFRQSPTIQTTVVRFGGLFGGKRNPVKYLAGRSGLTNGKAPVNLIHREDCIGIILSILERDAFGHTFNAVIPQHPNKENYYFTQAQKYNLEPPKYKKSQQEDVFKKVHSINIPNLLNYSFKNRL